MIALKALCFFRIIYHHTYAENIMEAKMNKADRTDEIAERSRDNSGEVKIFGKGDDIQTPAESRPSGRVAFVVVFLIAIFCICFGIYRAWE